jgi:hypothetical protein
MIIPFKLAQEPDHVQNIYIQKTKAITFVTTIPCTAGNVTIAAIPKESHNGIRS